MVAFLVPFVQLLEHLVAMDIVLNIGQDIVFVKSLAPTHNVSDWSLVEEVMHDPPVNFWRLTDACDPACKDDFGLWKLKIRHRPFWASS